MNSATTRLGEEHRPLRDLVCDEIREQIVSGGRQPGTHLIEDRLARELGVSRNPVREALRVLETEGFVDMIPRRGAVVAQPSDDEVRELFQVRVALEALAARLAARLSSDDEAKSLFDILNVEREALERGVVSERTAANSEFHDRILDLARNRYLKEVMLRMRSRTQWLFSQTAIHIPPRDDAFEEHVRLAQAIADGDEDTAAEFAAIHVEAAAGGYWEARAALTSGSAEDSTQMTGDRSD